MRRALPLALLSVLTLTASPARADVWTVGSGPGADTATIQAALDLAAAGDTVDIECGEYLEDDLHILVPDLLIRSVSGDWDCVTIRGDETETIFPIDGLAGTTRLSGLTIERGLGGVRILDSSVEIQNCRLRWNLSGGLGVRAGTCHAESVWFLENPSSTGGAGASLSLDSNATFVDCTFERGGSFTAGGAGAWVRSGATALFEDCRFLNNDSGNEAHGSALRVDGEATARRCFLTGNSRDFGSPYFLFVSSLGQLTIESSTTASNGVGGSGGLIWAAGQLTMRHCLVAGHDRMASAENSLIECSNLVAGFASVPQHEDINGNFSADPLFCGTPGSEYSLQDNSPCAPENSNGCGLIGAYGVACGTISVEPSTWSSIKARWR